MARMCSRRLVPGRGLDLQLVAAFRARGARASRADLCDGRRVAYLMVPMRAVRARPLVARCDRVELCRRCDLGVCHHLGPAGGLMLKCWVRGWRALVLAILNGAESGLLVQKCA